MALPETPPPGPMEPEFAGLLMPMVWLELAEEAALAAREAWSDGAMALADIGRAQALMMTDSLSRLLALTAQAADSIMAPPAH